MIVEQKLQGLGLVVPDLEQDYATNPSGARFISHYAVQNVLYLSGTAPVKDGQPYRPGVVGKDLTVEQAYDAARYAVLTTLSEVGSASGRPAITRSGYFRLAAVSQAVSFWRPPAPRSTTLRTL